MADLTANRSPNRLGLPEAVLIANPVGPLGLNTQAASTEIFAGALCGYNTSGQIDNIDGTNIVTVAGVNSSYTNNKTTGVNIGGAADGVQLVKGAISFLCDGTVTGTLPYGTDLYAVDNQTLSADPGNARIRAGFFEGMDPSNTANCICNVGQASPLAMAPGGLAGGSASGYARAVVTTLDAYTGSGTSVITETTASSGLGTQDGITLVVGDVVFIQAGTTNLTAAKDAGPWVVTSLGTASVQWILTRPSWWQNGSSIAQAATIKIGGEGTSYAGTDWKTFCAKGKLVGTDDPTFYVGRWTTNVTLVTGFVKLGPSQTFPGLFSTTKSGVEFTPTNYSGASLTVSYRTGVYASGGSATAAGALGTSTVSITALVAAGTFNTSDVGTGLVTIINW